MRKFALLAFAVIASAPASAGQYNVQGQTITQLATGWGAEGFYVATTGDLPVGASCGNGSSFMMEPGHPLQREIVAMLLAAQQSRAKINIYVDGCVGGAMKLKAVSVDS